MSGAGSPSRGRVILEIRNLRKRYPVYGSFGRLLPPVKYADVLSGVSFSLREGEVYGLVGESGCGKTTTGRAAVGLVRPDSGEIIYNGKNLAALSMREFAPFRGDIQMVFQDSLSSLPPRQTVGEILEESLIIHRQAGSGRKSSLLPGSGRAGSGKCLSDTGGAANSKIGLCDANSKSGLCDAGRQVSEMLRRVGLTEEHRFRRPHELSGGQAQRVGIARALMVRPRILICDEAVSALDVSIQAQILNMLMDLRKETGITILFISHDICVVRCIADRVGVMYGGRIAEEADTETLFKSHHHPYTAKLLSSAV